MDRDLWVILCHKKHEEGPPKVGPWEIGVVCSAETEVAEAARECLLDTPDNACLIMHWSLRRGICETWLVYEEDNSHGSELVPLEQYNPDVLELALRGVESELANQYTRRLKAVQSQKAGK